MFAAFAGTEGDKEEEKREREEEDAAAPPPPPSSSSTAAVAIRDEAQPGWTNAASFRPPSSSSSASTTPSSTSSSSSASEASSRAASDREMDDDEERRRKRAKREKRRRRKAGDRGEKDRKKRNKKEKQRKEDKRQSRTTKKKKKKKHKEKTKDERETRKHKQGASRREEERPPGSDLGLQARRALDRRAKATGATDLYSIDLTGDKDILTYLSFYKKDIRDYWRAGRGLVIGINGPFWIRDGRNLARPPKEHRHKDRRIHDPRFAAKLKDAEAKVTYITSRVSDRTHDALRPAPSTSKRMHDSFAERRMFVPLEDADTGERSDTGREDSDKDIGEDKQAYIQRRKEEFNVALRQHPEDTRMWRDYIDFQDDAFAVEAGHSHKAVSLLIARKLALYEEAMKHNPDDEDLVIGYLELCGQKLAPDDLEQKWTKTLFVRPNKHRLWQRYLAHSTAHLARFTVSSCQSKFHKCIETLDGLKEGSFATHHLSKDVAEETLLDVVFESCHFQAKAGHTERAVACLQALVEYNLFMPSRLRRPREATGFLETFWEANVPRFGDSGARGITHYLDQKRAGREVPELTQQHPPSTPPVLRGITTWENWLELEAFREHNHWQPWRPNEAAGESEDDCDDPDRCVIFDDVAGHLFRLSTDELKTDLVLGIVDFLGANVRARTTSNSVFHLNAVASTVSMPDTFTPLIRHLSGLKAERKRSLLAWRRRDPGPYLYNEDFVFREKDDPHMPARARVSGMAIGEDSDVWGSLLERSSDDEIFDRPLVNRGLYGWHVKRRVTDPSRIAFIRNVFEQAIAAVRDPLELQLSYAEFLEQINPRDARLYLKGILKENREDVALFVFFAQLEDRSNKPDRATKVFKSTLQFLTASPTPEQRLLRHRFVRSFSEHLLKHSEWNKAKQLVMHYFLDSLHAVDLKGNPPPPTLVMRAGRACDEMLRALWTKAQAGDRFVFDEALLCVHYALLFRDSTAMQHLMETVLDSFDDPSHPLHLCFPHEILYAACYQLLEVRANLERTPPAAFRRLLERALGFFPYNPEFLSAYVALEAQFAVCGRARALFRRLTTGRRDAPAVVWLVAIVAEVTQVAGASVHRVRTLLSDAVKTEAKHCALIWRMYMEFTRAQSGLEGLRLSEDIFYQSLQACPGVKRLYLDAAKHNPRNLDRILDIMQEKELHLRAPLQEIEILEAEQQEQKEKGAREANSDSPTHVKRTTQQTSRTADGMATAPDRSLPAFEDDDDDGDK